MTDFVLPHAMPAALDGRGPLKLLSLDCFDTLLWRDTHAPSDIFDALPGITSLQRQWAEARARTAAEVEHRRSEVSLTEIYRELFPNGDAATLKTAIQAELDAEARHCFGFAPTLDLMREGKRRGLGIIIVSDTYLDEVQLRSLIARAAGADVAAMIDRLFCSSVHGRSKEDGLYECVLKAVGVQPGEILHIGDNRKADVEGVQRFGVQTLHLKQFDADTEQRLRLESAASAILHPRAPGTIAAQQPHRATLAATEPMIADDAEGFGFSVLGPTLHAFERWLAHEAAALQTEHGGTVHWLFMMRDGYLPMLVHQASGHPAPGHPVEISRFTATAATLTSETAVERYLQMESLSAPRAIFSQLLLPPNQAALVLKGLPKGKNRIPALLRAIRQPQRMRQILRNGTSFAERLAHHVRNMVQPAPGDTLMLVDLGYNGSVQNEIDALLRTTLNVHVAGRYLLLREQSRTDLDKKGLIDHDNYDAHTLETLCANVAVLEQLCTSAQGSTVDYRADGTPIRKGNSIKARQSAVRERIQAGCIRFGRDSATVRVRGSAIDDLPLWRRAVASVLGRLMYLPQPSELAIIADFEHDINLGVDDTVALFDPAIARRGLRQRGLFYMKGSERMYLPAELQGEGLALKLSLLAQKRFGLPFNYADFVDTSIRLPLIVADGMQVSTDHVAATPTHDGYYLAAIPIGDCRFSIGIQFGLLFDWVQVESATFMPVETFLSAKHRPGQEERDALPSLEGMAQVAPHLFHCESKAAFMMVPPPRRTDDRPLMLAVVFRPIAERQPAASTQAQRLIQSSGATA